MAPSEESILTRFLVQPSPLPTVISLEKFREFFPKKLRSHPQIRTLYRELQYLRAQDVDLVRQNIDDEIRRGERQKEDLKNAIAQTGVSGRKREDEIETNLDIQLFGQPSNPRPEDMHTLDTLIPDMERACAAMERQIEAIQAESAEVLKRISTIVDELSDLRYGKFDKPNDFADEVVRGLKKLESTCDRVSSNNQQT
ncbi:hypothetical protein VTO42DRAFT_4991 [Malbranchea cinnamomea]